ncbi:VRR-NUC domain-containing protein [Halalkalibacterium halodurans]|uniref:VRR-NUC domain-containing protein n=1 Tax=Halalkalibacterium halodurans TaxID=86665 RepID=UPI002AA9E060|nr:VRR-NUC domain-containing protein [Halalkalibacterium halodurans]MDY7224686.1 VRR-NUC domain-containing protein [Halalkalibacterium halodurans]MDY7243264.1 VRR-NUC domain-containing protein [Halalkalibacterium halodurans]
MREKTVENSIKRYLDNIGAWYIKTHGSMFSKAGTPDIIACVKGTFVAIEVKKPGGVVSELQKAHIKLIQQAGGVAFVADSLEETKQHLAKLDLV